MESISENQELIQKFMDLLEHHLGEYSPTPLDSLV